MTKTLKNKKVMLIALVTLLAVVSSAFIGTLARYVTSSSESDGATVAKFGLNTSNEIDLFQESYGLHAASDTTGKRIIAPGTSGSYEFEVSGTSEVAYEVTADASIEYSDEWDGYEPLEFSLDGVTWTSFEDFNTNLSTALKSGRIAPNADYENTQELYWRWPFEVIEGENSDKNDEKDTGMGLAATTANAPTVIVTVTITAAQLDA